MALSIRYQPLHIFTDTAHPSKRPADPRVWSEITLPCTYYLRPVDLRISPHQLLTNSIDSDDMGLFKKKERPSRPATPSAVYANTQVTYTDTDFTHPPDLNYSLRTRKKWIAVFWSLVIIDCVFVPIVLYFGLWYGTSLSHNAGTVSKALGGQTPLLTIHQFLVSAQERWAVCPLRNTSSDSVACGKRTRLAVS